MPIGNHLTMIQLLTDYENLQKSMPEEEKLLLYFEVLILGLRTFLKGKFISVFKTFLILHNHDYNNLVQYNNNNNN